MSQRARPPVPTPGTTALFLDADATLIEVPPHGEVGIVAPERILRLAQLYDRLDGALALVSRRTVEALDELVAPLNLTLLGVHGLDRRLDDGRRVRPEADAALASARAALGTFALAHDGVRFEDKGVALALHAGGDAAVAARDAAERALAAADGRLVLQATADTVELLPAGHDAATALAALAQEPPFQGRRPVFVAGGEAHSAGLRAAETRGGMGVVVGPEPAADAGGWRLDDVRALESWLDSWLSR